MDGFPRAEMLQALERAHQHSLSGLLLSNRRIRREGSGLHSLKGEDRPTPPSVSLLGPQAWTKRCEWPVSATGPYFPKLGCDTPGCPDFPKRQDDWWVNHRPSTDKAKQVWVWLVPSTLCYANLPVPVPVPDTRAVGLVCVSVCE